MKQIYIGAAQRSKLFAKIKKAVFIPHLLQLAIFLLLILVPVVLSGKMFSKQNMGMSNVTQIGTPYGIYGSAVLISNDKLLTCAHVMEGMAIDDICAGSFVDPNDSERPVIGFVAQLIAIGKYFPKENSSEDYALLQIVDSEIPIERITQPCPLYNSKDVKVGDAIQVVGYPDEGYLVTSGVISSLKSNSNPNLYIVDAKSWHGNSGGALLNSEKELMGIVIAGGAIQEYNDDQTYVLSLDYIREALSRKGFQL